MAACIEVCILEYGSFLLYTEETAGHVHFCTYILMGHSVTYKVVLFFSNSKSNSPQKTWGEGVAYGVLEVTTI